VAAHRMAPGLLVIPFLFSLTVPFGASAQQATAQPRLIPLPAASLDGTVSVERALSVRRSHRSLSGSALSLQELSQLLWAAQGVTLKDPDPLRSRRTAPSAGATYPMEVYAVVGAVEGLEAGIYHYVPASHALAPLARGDRRTALFEAAGRQAAVQAAPVTLVLAAVVARTAARYGERAERYVHIEVGAVAENVHLQVESLDLGTVFIGSFRDEQAKSVLGLPAGQVVLGLMPIGRIASD